MIWVRRNKKLIKNIYKDCGNIKIIENMNTVENIEMIEMFF